MHQATRVQEFVEANSQAIALFFLVTQWVRIDAEWAGVGTP